MTEYPHVELVCTPDLLRVNLGSVLLTPEEYAYIYGVLGERHVEWEPFVVTALLEAAA